MNDFRQRRKWSADEMDCPPGLRWSYAVNRNLVKGSRQKFQKTGDTGLASANGAKREVIIGDIGFADDTALAGFMDETMVAEGILAQTMQDWEERVNIGKTERLKLPGMGRNPYDTRELYDVPRVRHLGAILSEDGSNDPDTSRRAQRGYEVSRKLAKAWGLGSHRGRGIGSGLTFETRLKAMRACAVSTMTAGCRSRTWNKYELKKLQRVANYCVRRAFGMDIWNMERTPRLGRDDA